jgi:hypothetical protein
MEVLNPVNFKNYFFFGVNFRYQTPVFAVSLRKFSNSNDNFFFNFGFFTNNLIGELNFGSSLKQLFNTLRGKSKISRIYFSKGSVAFTNPFVFNLVHSCSTIPVYSSFEFPKYLVSAEVFSKFVYSSHSHTFNLSLPHFFLSNQIFPRYNKLQFFSSPITSQEKTYFFYFLNKKFIDFRCSNSFINFRFNHAIYLYSNFFSHFSYFDGSKSSLNTLLALKRQSLSRSSFVYYS